MLVFFVVLALTLAHEMLSINVGGPDRYDFIIVGGGAAGSTIARKLTDSGASVLLLEAGTSTQYDLGELLQLFREISFINDCSNVNPFPR